MILNNTDIITISGKRHSGKTILSNFLIGLMIENNFDVEILDVNREYDIDDVKIHRFADLVDYRKRFPEIINSAMQKRDKFLVFDDVDIVIDQNRMPDSLENCIKIGRHNNVGMMLIFRRINTMHKEVIFNTDHFFIFRSKLLLDREYFSKYLSNDYDIINLSQYEFFYADALTDAHYTGKININKNEMVLYKL